MKRRTFLLSLTPALAATLERKPGASLTLEVDKTGLMAGKKHRFTFDKYSGTVTGEAAQPESVHVSLAIVSDSIACTDTWVKESDRAKILAYARKEMLDVGQFPEIRFTSKSVGPSPDRTGYAIQGQLTIQNRTQPVTVQVQKEKDTADGWWTGSCNFQLTQFGLKPPSAALGAIGTKDEVRFTFRLFFSP